MRFRRADSSASAGEEGAGGGGGAPGGVPAAASYDVALAPAALDFAAVQYAMLPAGAGTGGAGAGTSSSAGITTTTTSSSSSSTSGTSGGGSSSPAAQGGGGGVGYLRIITFTETVPGEVEEALAELVGGGAGALVLDLRDDPGGLVSAGERGTD